MPARKLRIDVDDLWYRNAVIYCLSVATYMDGHADGVGDFRGVDTPIGLTAGAGSHGLVVDVVSTLSLQRRWI